MLRPLAFLLALAPSLVACTKDPEETGDPSETGETGHDDATSFEASGEALDGCGDMASVIWMPDPSGHSTTVMSLSSTVAGYCALYWESVDFYEAGYPAVQEAYEEALAAGDYQAACQAQLAWFESNQPYYDGLYPQGACTLQVVVPSAEAGSYDTTAGAWVAAVRALDDLGAALVAAWDGCAGVMDQASLDAAQQRADSTVMDALDLRMSAGGTLDQEPLDGDLLSQATTDLTLEDEDGASSALSFSLTAELCAP